MLRLLILQIWSRYERGEMKYILDTDLTDDLDVDEACKFLKVGLLCTQDTAKLRPSMSDVVRMLTGEKDADLETITKPGILGDFLDLRSQKPTDDIPLISSGRDSSPLSSENTTRASENTTP
ncbi:hypothetical protein BHE74_00034747 [Ensete ventricosum]|uniref:Uncharacterized protein n=1 Tax=Ensete ventricosum TaxID=4639 RepID=A0A444ESG8_ENSVE|nr:hypothetical protein GW17_00023015 [Ensete ventricosum]RWW58413.1 hypothetical protein BHE74_00034747 [Ensete ventricosum]RZR70552.1 hypothetical protein BHM03_00000429 [Ensete ventricosum]